MKYRTIVADPPWPVKGAGRRLPSGEGFPDAAKATRPLSYPTMDLEAIRALSVSDLTLPNAHLFLWTTNGFLEHSYSVVRAWGFRPVVTLTWAKSPMGGGLGGAFGITTEFIVYGKRGRPKELCRIPTTWFNWPRGHDGNGKRRHSAKPPHLWDMVQQLCNGPYLELFAREPRMGVDAWGPHAGLEDVELP